MEIAELVVVAKFLLEPFLSLLFIRPHNCIRSLPLLTTLLQGGRRQCLLAHSNCFTAEFVSPICCVWTTLSFPSWRFLFAGLVIFPFEPRLSCRLSPHTTSLAIEKWVEGTKLDRLCPQPFSCPNRRISSLSRPLKWASTVWFSRPTDFSGRVARRFNVAAKAFYKMLWMQNSVLFWSRCYVYARNDKNVCLQPRIAASPA